MELGVNKGGVHISFEGGEGSGKTSQIELLSTYLKEQGIDTVVVRNPGTTQIGEQIRRILLNPGNSSIAIKTEVFLHAASLHQTLYEVVLPSLAAGKIVISDRHIDSALAYQGIARGAGEELINDVVRKIALEDNVPDITIYLDVPETLVDQRTLEKQRGDESRIENEPLSFHQSVRNAYLTLAEKDIDHRIVIIDGTKKVEEVFRMVLDLVSRALSQRSR